MSTNRQSFEISLDINVGTTKTFELTIIDPDTNTAKDLSDTNVYATGIVKILKPDGTQIGSNINISYITRASGIIQFSITDTYTTLKNAGNWIGNIEFKNITPVVIDQQNFSLNILESY